MRITQPGNGVAFKWQWNKNCGLESVWSFENCLLPNIHWTNFTTKYKWYTRDARHKVSFKLNQFISNDSSQELTKLPIHTYEELDISSPAWKSIVRSSFPSRSWLNSFQCCCDAQGRGLSPEAPNKAPKTRWEIFVGLPTVPAIFLASCMRRHKLSFQKITSYRFTR